MKTSTTAFIKAADVLQSYITEMETLIEESARRLASVEAQTVLACRVSSHPDGDLNIESAYNLEVQTPSIHKVYRLQIPADYELPLGFTTANAGPEMRRNLLLDSVGMQTGWRSSTVTVTPQADYLTLTSSSTFASIYQPLISATGPDTTIFVSGQAKAGNYNEIDISLHDLNTGAFVSYFRLNLTTGRISALIGPAPVVTPMAEGWWGFEASIPASSLSLQFIIYPAQAVGGTVRLRNLLVGQEAGRTVKVRLNGGAPFPLYDNVAGQIDPLQMKPSSDVWLRFDTNFNGYRVVFPYKEDTTAPVELIDTNTGGEFNYLAVTRNIQSFVYPGDQLYYCRFKKTNQKRPMTLNGIAVYEIDGSNPRPGRILAGQLYWLKYVPAGDPEYDNPSRFWVILSPQQDLQQDQTSFSLQLANQVGLAMREDWKATRLTDFDAIPRTSLFSYDFASSGDESKFRMAMQGPIVNGSPTDSYDPYDWSAGYIQKDTTTGDGLFWDHNHVYPGPGYLQLLLVLSPAFFPALNGINIENAILNARLKLISGALPPGAIIAWHLQMLDTAPGGHGKSVNYLYTDPLVSDLLGMGMAADAGVGWPVVKPSFSDTGYVDFTMRVIPRDEFWIQLGGSFSRGPGGTDTYSTAPIRRALNGTFASSILVVLFPQQKMPELRPQQKFTGTVRFDSFSLDLVIPSSTK